MSETAGLNKKVRKGSQGYKFDGHREATQIKPGEVRNPHGRPKKENCLTSVLKSELCKIPEQLPNSKPNTDKLTWAQILGAQAIQHAAKGNSPYYKEILDRVEGKVKEQVEQTIKVVKTEDLPVIERKTRVKLLLDRYLQADKHGKPSRN